jgi:hypothetical protein
MLVHSPRVRARGHDHTSRRYRQSVWLRAPFGRGAGRRCNCSAWRAPTLSFVEIAESAMRFSLCLNLKDAFERVLGEGAEIEATRCQKFGTTTTALHAWSRLVETPWDAFVTVELGSLGAHWFHLEGPQERRRSCEMKKQDSASKTRDHRNH